MEVTNGLVIIMTYNPQNREEIVAALDRADRAIVAAEEPGIEDEYPTKTFEEEVYDWQQGQKTVPEDDR